MSLTNVVADLQPRWPVAFLLGGTIFFFFLKVLKQTSGGGDETWDAFNLEGFIRKAAQR